MFQYSERHNEEFARLGYTVFRGIIPPALITDLRRQCDRGAEQVRAAMGPQVQRFQPLSKFDLDFKPFEDYCNLPPLRDAVARLLSPQHVYGSFDIMGVLLSPAEDSYCTQWHRDWRDNMMGLDILRWEADSQDLELFNQINCALYEDSCTWVVPGSHLRLDTPQEAAVFPDRPINGPDLADKTDAERERLCLEYCNKLPGAQRLLLDAGDFCIYRNTLWHLGNYIPYRKRATLHDAPVTPKFKTWIDDTLAENRQRVESGLTWENPNQLVRA